MNAQQKARLAQLMTYRIDCLTADESYEGNCSAIGIEEDKATEQWITDQLRKGNDWAWCCVRVRCSWASYHADTYLGNSSYLSEEDFKKGGYYEDMKQEAFDALVAELEGVERDLATLNPL